MSNTDVRGSRGSGVGGRKARARRRVFFRLLTSVFCLLFVGCRQDMQDQPRYEYYEPGDKKFFADGASSRPQVEGTVPRQPGEYRDREDYLYTGRAAGPAAGGGGGQMGVGTAAPNVASGLSTRRR
ncbi:MAG: hypothetical protein LC795_13675 [Acidobacteria bacterium]|nr:hypothetical protein [Acidobacteriota bacterium]